ncbi:MAG TPA: hypothetical protein VM580_26955 [Labilithrix sp.]|nr:hypothetical protein [Labilithrix sp.]
MTSLSKLLPRDGRSRWLRAGLPATALAVALGACFLPEARTEGALQSSGGMRPLAACSSGERRSFFGVDLIEEGGRTLRLVDDPIYGLRGRYSGPDLPEEGVVLDGSSCRVLRATIAPTGWRINGIRVLEGNATLDCVLPDNSPVRGEVRFSGCS